MSSSTPPAAPPPPGTAAPVNLATAEVLQPRVAFESWAVRDNPPPGTEYVTPDDFLLVTVNSSVAGITVQVRARLFQPDGQVIPLSYAVAPPGTRVPTSKNFPLSEGFLLGLGARIEVGTARRGQVFVAVQLVRGAAVSSDPVETLFADYVASGHSVGWPAGQVRQSIEGPGILNSILGTLPAAGAQITEVVPTGARWLLRSFRAGFQASAAVANRRVHFIVDDGANILLDLASPDLITGGQQRNINFDPAAVIRAAQDSELYVPIFFDWRLFTAYRIRTTVTAMDVGDQWTAPRYQVEEWLEP